MEERFEDRVKRLFGSCLLDSVPDTSSPASLWSVAEGEVERREWNRGGGAEDEGGSNDRENDPSASAFDDEGGCFTRKIRSIASRDRGKKDWEGDLDDLDDEDDDGGGSGGNDDDEDGDREEREIRASVGLDPTLDREEEEDEYDRRALNSNNTSDRVYMRDVMFRGPYPNIHSVVPDFADDSFEEVHEFNRDPRADHFAAGVRLNEDNKAVENGYSALALGNKDSSVFTQIKISEHDIKPILKRKDGQVDTKPKKRVRFDPGLKDEHAKNIETPQDGHIVPHSLETTLVSLPEESTGLPDYLRNPSKYTCYTLDWSEEDDNDTNKQAFNDFLNLVNKSTTDSDEYALELPKSIMFTSRKKSHDAMSVDNGSGDSHEESRKAYVQRTACFTDIVAGDTSEYDACEMEEDETSLTEVGMPTRKVDRKYRSKSSSDDST